MGFYRTGKFWAIENFGITPDIIVFGKALTNGLNPISGIWAREELITPELFPPGSTHSTFSSNTLGTAVALETLKMLEEDDYEKLVNEKGAYFLAGLRKLQSRYPGIIGNVDGLGLALRLEVCKPDGITPDRELDRPDLCRRHGTGILRRAAASTAWCSTWGATTRTSSPLPRPSPSPRKRWIWGSISWISFSSGSRNNGGMPGLGIRVTGHANPGGGAGVSRLPPGFSSSCLLPHSAARVGHHLNCKFVRWPRSIGWGKWFHSLDDSKET